MATRQAPASGQDPRDVSVRVYAYELAIMDRESPVEICLRDCISFLHWDGAQDSHRIRITNIPREGTA